jgi:SAM-dependent methyltransferase
MPASLEGSPLAGTASYYHRFRAPYAQATIDFIIEHYNLGKGVRVLDLGCGPDTIAIPLSYTVGEVVAVDPDPEITSFQNSLGRELGIRNPTHKNLNTNQRWSVQNTSPISQLMSFGALSHET